MRRKNHTHQQDIDDLKKQNALLEQQGRFTQFKIKNFVYIHKFLIAKLFFYVCCPQCVHWRKPRGTLSSSPTTLLTVACTQIAKAAPCPPSTAGPTPAPNPNQKSHPPGRSCAQSPARPGWPASPPSSPPWPLDGLFTHQRLLLFPVCTRSCLLMLDQGTGCRLC